MLCPARMRRASLPSCRSWPFWNMISEKYIFRLLFNPIQDLNFLRQMIEDDNQFLEVLSCSCCNNCCHEERSCYQEKRSRPCCHEEVMRKTGDSPWNAACVEGDEAVDEKCRQDTEQLSGSWRKSNKVLPKNPKKNLLVARGGKRDGQLHSTNLLQACLPGSVQVER